MTRILTDEISDIFGSQTDADKRKVARLVDEMLCCWQKRADSKAAIEEAALPSTVDPREYAISLMKKHQILMPDFDPGAKFQLNLSRDGHVGTIEDMIACITEALQAKG